MAVGAAYVALLYLSLNRREAVATASEYRDGSTLGAPISVVEFQDTWVCFTTIQTWVAGKVVKEPIEVVANHAALPRSCLGRVVLAVIDVVPASQLTSARAAVRVPLDELRGVEGFAASRTSLTFAACLLISHAGTLGAGSDSVPVS